VKDSMIAEDLVQNVWLKVTKRLKRLNDISLFRSWLFRALRWEILDWLKSKKIIFMKQMRTMIHYCLATI